MFNDIYMCDYNAKTQYTLTHIHANTYQCAHKHTLHAHATHTHSHKHTHTQVVVTQHDGKDDEQGERYAFKHLAQITEDQITEGDQAEAPLSAGTANT